MKHILVPVSFSDYSDNASRYALRIAAQHGAKITILHAYHIPVIDPTIPLDYLATIGDDLERKTSRAIEKVIQELKVFGSKNKLNSVEITPLPKMGLAVDEITGVADKLHCDLIVMGRRHTEGMAKVLLGSIISEVIQKAKIPLLVVPENTDVSKPVADVLYASGLDSGDKSILLKLLDFVQPTNARVHCVHVNSSGETEDSASEFEELARNYPAEKASGKIIFEKIVSENVEDALLDYLETQKVGLLAMLTHKRNFFMKLFDRSLTRKVAFRTNIPLLVYHDENNQ